MVWVFVFIIVYVVPQWVALATSDPLKQLNLNIHAKKAHGVGRER